ncbi:MAG: efflux RND transporter periplasmic adaptor subunit [Verrucomicrobia bacterium]|nr:efflux RND transporter periplasmic adaptor subunit [Verrucomicrobiota bacterium]
MQTTRLFPPIARTLWLVCVLFADTQALIAASPPAATELKFTSPVRGDITRFVALPGTVRPLQQATLYAKAAGYIASIRVDKGDAVKEGDLLAEIEAPELIADRARAKADVLKAKAEVARIVAERAKAGAELARSRAEIPKAKAELDFAALDHQRLRDANKKAPDLVVQQQVDAAKAKHDVAAATLGIAQANVEATRAALEATEAAVGAAEAAVTAANANLERVETLLGFTRITAPFAGIITARYVDKGAFIPAATSGSAAQGAAIVTVMDFKTVRVQVPVPEPEVPLVVVGQPVRVAVEELPGMIEGRVTRHAFALEEMSKTMLVEAEIPNSSLKLRPGMYAIVSVGVEQHKGAQLVPVAALVMEKANAFVFTLVGGEAKKTKVKLGFNDGKNVEITDGLTGTEKVLLVGKTVLTDGQVVNATEAK